MVRRLVWPSLLISADIVLHPPDVKPLKCKDWIRIRNKCDRILVSLVAEVLRP